MGKWSAERLAATTGIGFVVLFVIAYVVATQPPDSADPNAEWVSYFLNHHRATLISAVLLGAALMFFVWFLGSVGAALRRAGEPRLAAVAFGGGVTAVAMGGVIASLQAAVTYRIAAEAPLQVKAFVDVAYSLQTLISFPIAVLIGATAIASWRAKLYPEWWTALSGAGAVVMVSGGGALSQSGFYRPDGPWAYVTLIVFLVWTLVTSGWLAVRAEAAEAPAAATAA